MDDVETECVDPEEEDEDEEEEDDDEFEHVGNGRRKSAGSVGKGRNGKTDFAVSVVPIGDSIEWQRTIEKVVKSVVSVRFAQTASFDTEPPLVSEATGFVVDSKRGLIMTNRHVVGPGPFTGFAIFDNHEECDVHPIYRDPVHDFGLLRFDPSAIKYMQVVALELRPELAKVGAEIRVIGNDAGEKLSILSGFISRLDRNAPMYGTLMYNDFNTEYIQAAASASGGSSGSPVVNIDGYVVALQAGGSSESSTDFFLPLYRGLRALRCVLADQHISRGTIQVQWILKPFDECRRLGLTPEVESVVREKFPSCIGMLLAEVVLPDGPAHGSIEEGDCLVTVNGEHLTTFIRLDEILDSNVGNTVTMVIQRGGEDFEITLLVGDLHAITPDRFVEVSGATFHNLSYQLARQFVIPVKGVYIAEPAGSFRLDRDRGWMVESLNNELTPDLDTFIKVMQTIRDKQWVVATCRNIQDLHSVNTSIVHIDRHWTSEFRLAVRNDKTGLWDFEDLGRPLPPQPLQPMSAKFTEINHSDIGMAAKLARSMVRVTCLIPLKIDGFPRSVKVGHGVVIDAEKGLVLVARSVVPYDLCDIIVTVADSIMVPGKVVFLHPTHGWSVVSYDPSLVNAPVETAVLSPEPMERNSSTVFLGINQNMRIVVARTTVTDISTMTIPPNQLAPRYRASNIDGMKIDSVLGNQCASGMLADTDGVVGGLWLMFLGERTHNNRDVEYRAGLCTSSVYSIVQKLRAGETPNLRILDVELSVLQMNQARIRGVADEWIRNVEESNSDRHQLFAVRQLVCRDTPDVFEEGDVLLSINGQTLTRVSELDVMYDNETLDMVVLRQRKEISLKVPTVPTEQFATDRVVIWCGAVLHDPHHAVRQQIKKLHSGVYVSGRMAGSPAYQYQVEPTSFVTHVNGKATPDLSTFLDIVRVIPDNTYLRMRVVTFDNMPYASSIKSDLHYFPTVELVKDKSRPGEWKRYSYHGGVQTEESVGIDGAVETE
ncbi:trypsin-like cysteine/serine peptidase domain-containing protein [Lipomyces arxii]|uniref:trypsin-like cysteine/serine peptidase domain-containing protein n=1 Tax=Lipomyces arxii TaxID=56418 RepID=UPI0034CE1538